MHREEVEKVESFKIVGVHISADLTWTTHISHQVYKAQQRLYFLRKLKHAHFPQHLVTNFYRSALNSFLNYWFTVFLQLHNTGREGPAAGGEGSGACHHDDTTPSQRHLHPCPLGRDIDLSDLKQTD